LDPIQCFGKYLLFERLATGGMAEIWLAKQTGLGRFSRFVVVKKILGQLGSDPSLVEMFLDEARLTVRLNHPNIVQVYDLGLTDGTYFLAMEYLAGENLAAITWRSLKSKRSPALPIAVRIVAGPPRTIWLSLKKRRFDSRRDGPMDSKFEYSRTV
jgi:serine/threonine-protein kinase